MNLDSIEEIKKLDKSDVAGSITKFPDQIEQAWKESSKVEFPEEYRQIDNIIIAGMGGSALGPELLQDVFKDQFKVPLNVVRSYDLPKFAGENTLVVLSSYSGTTEELLAVAEEASDRKCKIIGITEGKQLGDFLDKNKLPYYKIIADNNPSKQPRLGIGYSVAGFVGMFNSLGLIQVSESEISDIVASGREVDSGFLPSIPTVKNFPKELASKLQGNAVAVVSAEFLSANAHVFANQLNETSKTFSSYYLLSELNHHLLEGFSKPDGLGESLKVVILTSDQYSEKIKKRVKITTDVIEKQKVETFTVRFEEGSKLNQAFEAIIVSSWVTFYLGILNNFDPSEIPWVDYFKKELDK